MRLKSYFSHAVEDAVAAARQELGTDAMLVNSRKAPLESRHPGDYEVVFATDLATQRALQHGPSFQTTLAEELESRIQVEPMLGRGEVRPRIVAFVGPPGAGKTTTLVKLAVNYGLSARRPVLLLSLDTYRVAAA